MGIKVQDYSNIWGKLDERRICDTFMDYLHKALDTLSIVKERTMNAIIIHSSLQALSFSITFPLIIPTQTGGFD